MLNIVWSKFLIECCGAGQSSGATPSMIIIVRYGSPLKLLLNAGLETAS